MPKAKLKINSVDFKKMAVAAEISGVKLIAEQSRVIGDESIIMASAPQAATFFELGKMFKSVTGNELDGQPAPAEKKKAAEKPVKA